MSKVSNKKVLIATGGSGGHIIPALAIAKKLKEENITVEFIGAGGGFTHLVEKQGFIFHNIKAFKYNNRGPIGKLKAIVFAGIGLINAGFKINNIKPNYVLGMGGYASIATLIAAKFLGLKTAIHEQNVKPGRTNKLLAHFADSIFLSFEEARQFMNSRILDRKEVVVTGCPVEDKFLETSKLKRTDDGKFKILIMGGSQGARILADVVPQALITLPKEIKQNLKVVQQTRPEDIKRVEKIYEEYNIEHDVASYFNNVEKQMLETNLVIGRSGAGTICETSVLGRVAIFVPLMLADGHQIENARILSDRNAAFILEAMRFTPSNLAYEVLRLAENPDILATMERNSLTAIKQSRTAAQTIANEILDELK